ncbi:MAG: divalent metal cation transporter [Nitrososphaeraceae archaeon]|nr:divalent metal cation transporter [Nitrososphaeraceae archaeon]
MGPGLITGAADEDPATIGTYSQAGAQFGFGFLWLALFQYPMIAVVQEMCARIGIVTGSGLGSVIKKKYSKKIVVIIASLILVANTINIGADIGAMAASVRLLVPEIPIAVATVSFAAFIVLSEMLIPYNKYVKILKYLTISLLAYIVTAIIVGGNAEHILGSTIVPHFEFTPAFAMMFVAIFGATLTPYAFFWQASEEAEEDVAKHKIIEINQIGNSPEISKNELKAMKSDVATGMALSQLVMWAIIITTATTLNANNITDIQTADQAAKSLQPLVKGFPASGELSKTIFALGIIGTGLLAIPVLAGASGYALSEAFGWKEGLNKSFSQARNFHLIIAASTIIGLLINFTNLDPIRALVYSSVINGVVAAPILVAVIKVANDKKILKDKVNGKLSNVIGWTVVVIMGISVLLMIFTWGH